MYSVYMIKDEYTGKKYIGLTKKKPLERINEHLDEVCNFIFRKANGKKYTKGLEELYKDMSATNISRWTFHILDSEIQNDQIKQAERFYISLHNAIERGYNSSMGGEGIV